MPRSVTIARVLANGGVFLASVRDYDTLRVERPSGTSRDGARARGRREIVGQAWEWSDDGERIRIHLFVVREGRRRLAHRRAHHLVPRARPGPSSPTRSLEAGFEDVQWHLPDESGYYQPIVTARTAR